MHAAIARRQRVRQQRLEALHARLQQQNMSLRVARARHRLEQAVARLQSISTRATARQLQRLNRAATRLEALSPLAVLSRGYAIAYSADGRVIRSAAETAPGQPVRVRLGQGSLEAEVKKVDSEG